MYIFLLFHSLSFFLHPYQRSYWPRGRVLGGSSNLNSMLYIRGSRHDYDTWAEQGSEGWSYKDVLPYFIKSEDNYNDAYVKSGELASSEQI